MNLTYLDLQRIYRAEKKTPALCKIDDDFYTGLSGLISRVEEGHIDSVKKMAQDISFRRRNKVLMQAMRTFDSEPLNALASEKRLYREVVDLLKRHQSLLSEGEGVVEEDPGGLKEESKEGVVDEGRDTVTLRIMKSIPSIVGSDAVCYGPFEASEEVELPLKTAGILIECGVAQEV